MPTEKRKRQVEAQYSAGMAVLAFFMALVGAVIGNIVIVILGLFSGCWFAVLARRRKRQADDVDD